MSNKKPWLAAILNFFVWGLGYLYVGKGKRSMFSIGLIIAAILSDAFYYSLNETLRDQLLVTFLIPGVMISIVFAWDAYQDAKEA